MPQIPFLQDLVLTIAVAVLAALALSRLKLPPVSVLLIAGAIVGPNATRLVANMHTIEVLAEVGVVFLLFTIGLEFSLGRLRRMGSVLLIGGPLQVASTLIVTAGAVLAWGRSLPQALFLGCVAALSSTAIALRALDREELDAPHGRIIVGTLILQDLLVVPMMLVVPVLAEAPGGEQLRDLASALARAVATVGLALIAARVVIPRLFAAIDRERSREMFLLAVLAVCTGTAWLTSLAGLSLALGAFLAGVVLAGSEYAHRALADVLPLRDLLTSLFFMSLGMLFDPAVLLEHPAEVSIVVVGLLAGKGLLAAMSALALGFPLRVALVVGVGLAQFSEFGFVLMRVGAEAGLIAASEVRVLMAAGVLTMLATPVLLRVAPRLTLRMGGRAATRGSAPHVHPKVATDVPDQDHVIVVGYGQAGQVVVGALRDAGVPVVVVELNAVTVRALHARGLPAVYGDIANPMVLAMLHADRAVALVIVINDPPAAERAVAAARHYAPELPVLVRVRYLRDVETLRKLGASEVVAEEVEGGVEMLARVLRQAGLSRAAWLERVASARDRTLHGAGEASGVDLRLLTLPEDMAVEPVGIGAAFHAVGRSPIELRLRQATGALAVAVRRGGGVVRSPNPEEPFQSGDMVWIMGRPADIVKARELLAVGHVEPS